jgi:hypothetical protein
MELIIGAIWVVLAFTVAYIGDSRKIGFLWALIASILLSPLIGLILVLTSEKISNQSANSKHKFKEFHERAKREEYKGNIEQAISLYLDTLYHLENDYKNLPQKESLKRDELISNIRKKIDELKTA